MARVKLYGIARDLVGKEELDVEIERQRVNTLQIPTVSFGRPS
jgi:molybdopterin converting factor small subunit